MAARLKTSARRRIEARKYNRLLSRKYEPLALETLGGVVGENLVSVGGVLYPAEGVSGSGASIRMVNVGRPSVARYAPANGTSVVVSGGGGAAGGSSGGSGGGVTYTAGAGIDILSNVISVDVTDIFNSAYGLTESSNQLRINLASPAGLEFNGGALRINLASPAGLEFNGGALRILDSIAGAGLVIASKVLAVGAGDGIDVAADSIAVDITDLIAPDAGIEEVATNNFGIKLVASGSGLSVGASGLMMGAPQTITVSSTNAISGSTHSTAIDHSNNPGANAKILSSTASGGLTLQTLAVQGNLDITNGGDLTVGANIFFVDASLESIGVNRAPDPQFDVDVAGALRAAYLVGKHAIQLDEALLIAHFDGRGPYATNTIGDYHGHAGQVPTVSGDVLVREGKFHSSVEIAAAYANLLSNRQFDAGSLTNWSVNSSGSAAGTRTTTQEDSYSGLYSHKIRKTGGAVGDVYGSQISFSATDTEEYAGAIWVKVLEADTSGANACVVRISLAGVINPSAPVDYTFNDDPDLDAGELPINEWVRIGAVGTATSTGSGNLIVRIQGATTATILVDAAQVTESGFQHPYFDGTRTQGSLSYAGIPVNWRRMTWMAWIRLSDLASSSGVENQVGEIRVDASNRYNLFVRAADDTLRLSVNGTATATSTGTIPANEWTHVAVTVSGLSVKLYINGVADGTGTISTLPVGVPTVQVGDRSTLDRTIGGHVDDFVITSKVEPADSIRAIYESDAPVFAESSVFHFKATPKQLVSADDEGLWMRNSAGGTVLGAYGGDATKSWAGLTLDPSDLMIGDSNRGAYMLWDDSAGAIVVGKVASARGNLLLTGTDISLRTNTTERFGVTGAGVMTLRNSSGNAVFTFDASAGAEFTLPLSLGTSGGIYQGSGTFASPTTGIKLFNSSGVGKLSGYNSGNEQVTLDTDGKLKAGFASSAWRLTLDRGGILLDNNSDNAARVKWGSSASNPLASIGAFSNLFYFQSGSSSVAGDLQLSARFNSGANDFSDIILPGAAIGAGILLRPDRDEPTELFSVTPDGVSNEIGEFSSSGAIGIGVDLGDIQGNLHIYANGSGFMHYTGASIGATPAVIIPNGTNDVKKTVRFFHQTEDSGGSFNNGGSLILDLAGSDAEVDLYSASGETLTARLKTDGQFEVYRKAGSGTFSINMILWWR